MDFFKAAKKLSQKQYTELAVLCSVAAVLLLVASFISLGGIESVGRSLALNNITPSSLTADILPCGWFGDCSYASRTTYGVTANTASVSAGSPVTLTWVAYSTTYGYTAGSCTPSSPCNLTGVGYVGSQCVATPPSTVTECGPPGPYGAASCTETTYPGSPCGYTTGNPSTGSATVRPNTTTTYSFCGTSYYGTRNGSDFGGFPFPTPCPSVTITVAPIISTPTLTIDAGAGPGVARTVAAGTPVTINTTATAGSGDTITGSSIVDNALNAVPGINTAVPPTSKSYVFTPETGGTYIFYPSVKTSSYPAWNNYSKSVTITVNGPTGPCSDIPAQATVPQGCVTPVPTPGICTPTGGSYSSGTNTCSCPAGKHLSGSACVTNPLCANGLNDSYAPSCTCPAGQYQPLGSNTCMALPICANGLNQSYSPSCTCPAGQVQVQGGSICVPKGSITSFTATPSRVLAGRTATVSWATSNMTACSVSAFDATGTRTLSSALSSTLTPTINYKTVFTLTCTDASDASYSSSVTVSLIPQTIEQ